MRTGRFVSSLSFVVCLVSAACAGNAGNVRPASPLAEPMDLHTLADSIDEPPGEPLSALAPDPLRASLNDAMPKDGDRAALLECARQAHASAERILDDDNDAFFDGLGKVALGIACGEAAAGTDGSLDPEIAAALEPNYALVRAIAPGTGVLPALERSMSELFHRADLKALFEKLPARAAARHAHAAAVTLRAGDSAAVARTLRHLAMFVPDGAPGQRVGFASEVIRRAGAQAAPDDWARLASAHYCNLDIDRGDLALAEARAHGGAETKATEDAHWHKWLAERVLALGGSEDVGEQSERASALASLERRREARSTLEGLVAAHPRDARPRAALVATHMGRDLDAEAGWRDASATLDLENADRDVYETVLGAWMLHALGSLLATFARDPAAGRAQLDADIPVLSRTLDRLEPLDAARADLLRTLLSVAHDAAVGLSTDTLDASTIAAFAAKHAEAIGALAARHPESLDAYRAAEGAFVLAPASAGALDFARRTPPPAAANLPAAALTRATLYLHVASRADALPPDAELQAVVAATPDVPKGTRDALEGVRLAVLADRDPRPASWQRAISAMQRGVDAAGGAAAPEWMVNNLLVASARGGVHAGANAAGPAWEAPGADPIRRVNAITCRLAGGELPEGRAVAQLLRLAGDTNATSAHSLAQHWVSSIRGAAPPPDVAADSARYRHGVVTAGSFQLGWGYSDRRGLVTETRVDATPWLVCPPPGSGPGPGAATAAAPVQ